MEAEGRVQSLRRPVMEAEKRSILCNSKGKTKVAGRASLTTQTTEERMDFLDHGEQVLSARDCPRCGPPEQLRCWQVKAGRPGRPTLGLWAHRECGVNSAEGSQASFRVSCQGHLLSPTALFICSFIQESENSLVAQWLGLCAFHCYDPGSTLGRGTKIPPSCMTIKKHMVLCFFPQHYSE